jgi:hypothetical protein
MFSRTNNVRGEVVLTASIAILFAVPASAHACCRSVNAGSPSVHACCHEQVENSTGHFVHALTACTTSVDECQCVRGPVAIQPHVRVTTGSIIGQHDLALGAAASTFIPSDATAGTDSEQFAAVGAAAVPHRILHCSWII